MCKIYHLCQIEIRNIGGVLEFYCSRTSSITQLKGQDYSECKSDAALWCSLFSYICFHIWVQTVSTRCLSGYMLKLLVNSVRSVSRFVFSIVMNLYCQVMWTVSGLFRLWQTGSQLDFVMRDKWQCKGGPWHTDIKLYWQIGVATSFSNTWRMRVRGCSPSTLCYCYSNDGCALRAR